MFLVLAVLATLVCAVFYVVLSYVTQQHLETLDDPVAALATMSAGDRALAEETASWPALFRHLLWVEDSPADVDAAWSEVVEGAGEHTRPRAELSREVALAAWGDAGAQARVQRAGAEAIRDLPDPLRRIALRLRRAASPPPQRKRLADFAVSYLAFELIVVLAGAIALVVWLRRGRPSILLHDDPGAGTWGLARGWCVLVWGGACGAACLSPLWFPGDPLREPEETRVWVVWALAWTPFVFLAYELLLRPLRTGFRGAYGLSRADRGALFWTVVVVLALDIVLSAVVGLAGDDPLAWREFVIEPVLLGDPLPAVLATLGVVVGAPVLEEFAFRGVLYPSLRSRMRPVFAAALAALLFAAIHGYSWPAAASVAVGGFLYALAYERTRSLVPVVLAHAIWNVMSVTWLLAYRLWA